MERRMQNFYISLSSDYMLLKHRRKLQFLKKLSETLKDFTKNYHVQKSITFLYKITN